MMSPRNILRILGGVFAPVLVFADSLQLGSANRPPDNLISVPVSLNKSSPVVGVQFEVRFAPGHVATSEPGVTASSDHEARGFDLSAERQRVVVFSRSNAEMPGDLQVQLGLLLATNSPSGGPSLSIENILFATADGSTVPSQIEYTFMEQWRRQNFSQAQRDNPGVIGDDQDPDGDFVSNLAEAFSAGNPGIPDRNRGGGVDVTVGPGGEVRLALRFLRTKNSAVLNEIEMRAETGVDLAQWTDQGVTVLPTGGGDGLADELEASVASPGDAIRHLHVSLRRKTPGE